MAQNYYAYTLINHLYYPEKIETGDDKEKIILDKYILGDAEKLSGCVYIPDRITNINGTHDYKLISSKDIDFENIYLKNSNISESAWGNFDEDRRWGINQQTTINETYELLNIIDYLLNATNNLYAEINALKYNDESENIIWFVANTISSNAAYYLNQVLQDSTIANGDTTIGVNKTLLDPKKYAITINAMNEDKTAYSFGIATTFIADTDDQDGNNYDLAFDRVIKKQHAGKKINGINAFIENAGDIKYETQTQTSNSLTQMSNLYGYLIGEDLCLYPGFNMFNFLNPNTQSTDIDDLIDFTNKKIKDESSFFKYETGLFKKIHIEFLGNNNENLSKIPYILYFIDKDENDNDIKYIIYYSDNIPSDILNNLIGINSKYTTYIDFTDGNGASYQFLSSINKNIPYIYSINDTNKIMLTVTTPQTQTFPIASRDINIQYYKNQNSIKVNVYNIGRIIENQEENEEENIETKKIEISNDPLQDNVTLYNPQRYNIPENSSINIKINASIIDDEQGNLKIDDEYMDYPYYWDDNKLNNIDDNEAMSYYRYTGLDNDTKQRIFTQFENANEFINYLTTNKYTEMDNFTQVYKKLEEPYKLKYNITSSELLDQPYLYSDIQDMVKYMNENCISKTNFDTISFSYNLPEEIEQLKFDLDLRIEETSKVKEVYKKVPFNINKIHDISINFHSSKLYEQEANNFKNIKYGITHLQNNSNVLITHISPDDSRLTAYDLYTTYSGELNYNDMVSYLTNSPNIIDFNNPLTYDNTGNDSKILNIIYNPSYNCINLIGGRKLNNALNTTIGQGQAQQTIQHMAGSYIGNTAYNSNDEQNRLNPALTQIFAIHGLGINNYCHGADSYSWGRLGTNNKMNLFNAINSHSLLSPCSYNNLNNISTYLGIAINQRYKNTNNDIILSDDITTNNLTYIKIKSGNNENYWQNPLLLDEDDEKYKYTNDFITQGQYDNIQIITSDIEINKLCFSSLLPKEHFASGNQNNNITYYIQSAYIKVLNSTFHPTPDCYPKIKMVNNVPTAEYDLNNTTVDDPNDISDYQKYINYKNCWGADLNNNEGNDKYYRPITVSLKMFENNNRGIPYFYESNEAKFKFNIVRVNDDKQATSLAGFGDQIKLYISPNIRYYISDFLNVKVSDENVNEYIGSYLYLDVNQNTKTMEFKEKLFKSNHEYNGESIIHKNNFTINPGDNVNLGIFPIPASEINENKKYNYNIERVSEINKMIYTYNGDSDKFAINSYLSYIDFYPYRSNSNITINDIINNDGSEKSHILPLTQGPLYGSKNYNSKSSAPTTGANITFKYIYREKPNNIYIDNYYPELEYSNNGNNKLYELFVYKKYNKDDENNNDLYVITDSESSPIKIKSLDNIFNAESLNNDNSNWGKAFKNNTDANNIYKYYYTQVMHFLNNTLCTTSCLTTNGIFYEIIGEENQSEPEQSPRSTINDIVTR